MLRRTSVDQEISLFRSRIQNRWVDDVTIRLLESILVSKDAQSSIEVRSVLKRFMRDESLLIFGEIAEELVEINLVCTEFLIRIFAMIGDVESCLALRYEALVMQDERTTIHPELEVTSNEWLIFAEHSLENGFYSIANQACERAHMYSGAIQLESEDLSHDVHAMEKIDRLSDTALLKISSRPVQAQAKEYLKKKKVEQSTHHLAISTELCYSDSAEVMPYPCPAGATRIRVWNPHQARHFSRGHGGLPSANLCATATDAGFPTPDLKFQ